MNKLRRDMAKVREALKYRKAGLSNRKIALVMKKDEKQIRRYFIYADSMKKKDLELSTG